MRVVRVRRRRKGSRRKVLDTRQLYRMFRRRLADLKRYPINVAQHPYELYQVMGHVAALKPKVFMEIGSKYGGALYLYAGCCAPGARIVSGTDVSAAR